MKRFLLPALLGSLWSSFAAGKRSGTVIPDASGRKWNYGDVKWIFMPVQ
jgi:hypothetical protein